MLFAGDDNFTDRFRLPVDGPTFYLVLGILCSVTGILKLLSPTLDGILLLGDLIPAAAGIAAGIMLIFGIYRNDTSKGETTNSLSRLGAGLLAFRKPIGIGLLCTAFVHFLLPSALFL